jgi:hypothetical protein
MNASLLLQIALGAAAALGLIALGSVMACAVILFKFLRGDFDE